MSTQQLLTRFFTEQLLSGYDGIELNGDDDLLISGLIDSLGVMQLIAFIEEELDVSVPPEDVTLENFQSINMISQYLQRQVA